MVQYACKFCKEPSDTLPEAEDCEAKGLIGPKIEKGLVVGTSFDAFYIFYNELEPENHERKYHSEKVDIFHGALIPWGNGWMLGSKMERWKEENIFRKATEEEVELLKSMLEKNVRGSGVIKVVMERESVEELHNRTDYFN